MQDALAVVDDAAAADVLVSEIDPGDRAAIEPAVPLPDALTPSLLVFEDRSSPLDQSSRGSIAVHLSPDKFQYPDHANSSRNSG